MSYSFNENIQHNESYRNQGTGIFSPHNSVLDALNHPQLEGEEPPSHLMNPDFSITSWQSVSSSASSVEGIRCKSKNRASSVLSTSDAEDCISVEILEEQVLEEEVLEHDVLENAASGDESVDSVHDSVPSFIMPKVSFNNGLLRVQVVGGDSDKIVDRLKSYRKSLKNVEFVKKEASLLVLVLNDENRILPDLLSLPTIPILIGKSGLAHRLSSKYICEPIRLQNEEDDLFQLIHFLSNVDSQRFPQAVEKMYSSQTGAGLPLEHASSIVLRHSRSLSLVKRKVVRRHDQERKKPKKFLSRGSKLIIGMTVGIFSLTVVWMWKGHKEMRKSPSSKRILTSNVVAKKDSSQFLSPSQRDVIKAGFDDTAKCLLRTSSMIIERAKMALISVLSFFVI